MTLARPVFALLLAFGLALPACAPSAGDAAERSRRGPITSADVEASMLSGNAYELVQSMRPEWLTLRGSQTFSGGAQPGIIVYVNDQRVGGSSVALREISVRDVRRIERLDSRVATNRFGAGHLHGAILVTTR